MRTAIRRSAHSAVDESRERLDVSLEHLLDDDAITHG
jgi:hypothetical protein